MQRNTFLEGKKKAQNGKPQPHAALYACIYLEYAEYYGLIYVLCFCYVLHDCSFYRGITYLCIYIYVCVCGICGILWNALCCLHFLSWLT